MLVGNGIYNVTIFFKKEKKTKKESYCSITSLIKQEFFFVLKIMLKFLFYAANEIYQIKIFVCKKKFCFLIEPIHFKVYNITSDLSSIYCET